VRHTIAIQTAPLGVDVQTPIRASAASRIDDEELATGVMMVEAG